MEILNMKYLLILLLPFFAIAESPKDAKSIEKEVSDLIRSQPNPNKSKPLLDSIAGVYKPKFQITVFNPDGEELHDVENIYEIVPIDDVAAYVKLKTITTNGHSCRMQGIFKYTNSKNFSFIDTSNEAFQGICRMKMTIEEDHIKFTDPNNVCKKQSCGVRASYDGAEVPLSLKRKIKYMSLLKGSDEYHNAVDEYKRLNQQ